MAEKRRKISISLLVAFCLVLNVSFIGKARAAELNFSQSILPVRFVYVQGGQIDRIWSNVSENDSAYVIKFFDTRTDREISVSADTINSYQEIVNKSRLVSGSVYATDVKDSTCQANLAVDFVRSNNTLEEVHTYS